MGSGWDDEPTVVWSPPEWVVEDEGPPSEPVSNPVAKTGIQFDESPRPEVEVEVRHLTGPQALGNLKRCFEIWTRNRVYVLDAQLKCIEVIDLKTGRADPEHKFLGSRCAGGQHRGPESNELSFPLPAPGSEAVFQKSDGAARIRLSVTSRVIRVLLHANRVKVTGGEGDRLWGRITRH